MSTTNDKQKCSISYSAYSYENIASYLQEHEIPGEYGVIFKEIVRNAIKKCKHSDMMYKQEMVFSSLKCKSIDTSDLYHEIIKVISSSSYSKEAVAILSKPINELLMMLYHNTHKNIDCSDVFIQFSLVEIPINSESFRKSIDTFTDGDGCISITDIMDICSDCYNPYTPDNFYATTENIYAIVQTAAINELMSSKEVVAKVIVRNI